MARPSAPSARLLSLAAAALLLVAGGTTPVLAHGEPTDGRAPTTGLRVAADGDCAGGYRIVGTEFCTHGPDTRPAGRRPALARRSLAAVIEGPLPEAVLCDGDGRSGKRVQAVYARVQGTPSRGATVVPQIRTAAASVQTTFLASAAGTDGVRRPRWVTDGACRLSVIEVALSPAARDSFNRTITELGELGLDRADRKYLVWWETSGVYCGIATFWGDDRPGSVNLSEARTGYARVDSACWGWAELHELMHTLGAVQNTAPHSTYGVAPGAFAHCTDDYDVMCYPDAPGVTMTVACPDRALDGLFDCGDDDYFHTSPESGTYLASHWNAADSGWLERTVARVTTPRTGVLTGGTVTARRVPVSASVASRAPLAGLEALAVQRRLDGGAWRSVTGVSGMVFTTTLQLGIPTAFRARTVDAAGVPTPWLTGQSQTARLLDDRSPKLVAAGTWRRVADATALRGTLRRSSDPGSTLTFRTDAAEAAIVAARGPLAGRLQVRVDGVLRRTVDLRATTVTERTIVTAVGLGPGQHTIEVRVKAPRTATPGWRVDLDAITLLAR